MRTGSLAVALAALICAAPAFAAENVVIPITLISDAGIGQSIGTVTAAAEKGGLTLTPRLTGLPPGQHGFHVHEKGSCAAADKDGKMTAGLAAGGHFDPDKTGKHEGPQGIGHRGDLPVLEVAADGTASKAVWAPRLTLGDLKGRSLMIHAGGDNYSDQPAALGGGGGRIACGVVP